MVTCIEDFIAASLSTGSQTELMNLYLKSVENEGYQNAVFAKARNRRLVSIPWNHFPSGYSYNYVSHGWDKIDPILEHIQAAHRPFHWRDACARMSLKPIQTRFLNECRELGVHSGLTIPLHGPGADVDLISLSLRDEKETDDSRMHVVYALTTQYRLRLGEIAGEVPEETGEPLTPKELECLCWCKEGKTNWEIGEILNLSEKTVEFHLSNTIRKLGASNRITAVVKGLQSGIIAL